MIVLWRCTLLHVNFVFFLFVTEMFGLSDHDLMFTQGQGRSSEEMSDDEHEVDHTTENDYIQHRVSSTLSKSRP